MDRLVAEIRTRYQQTLEHIAATARTAGRNPEAVKLVVVTKSQPLEVARAAIEAGACILGENYPEEGVMKIQSLADQSKVEWHMIGHVQSRKARMVVQHYALLHSLDSLKLAERLSHMAVDENRTLPVLLEFNVGGEESKYGWLVKDEKSLSALYPEIEQILELPNLTVRGLMTMPPLETNLEDARLHFRTLHLLADTLANRYPQADWSELSMGTSVDYEAAVQEGATLVRIGTAIVGSRPYQKGG